MTFHRLRSFQNVDYYAENTLTGTTLTPESPNPGDEYAAQGGSGRGLLRLSASRKHRDLSKY